MAVQAMLQVHHAEAQEIWVHYGSAPQCTAGDLGGLLGWEESRIAPAPLGGEGIHMIEPPDIEPVLGGVDRSSVCRSRLRFPSTCRCWPSQPFGGIHPVHLVSGEPSGVGEALPRGRRREVCLRPSSRLQTQSERTWL